MATPCVPAATSAVVGAIASHRSVLHSLGIPESTDEDPLHGVRVLAERVADNDPPAVRALRQAATEIGEIAAMLVYMFNPRTLVIGGPLSELRDDLLSGVRAAVYQRALPLATRKLTITTAQLGSGSGIHGGIALATRDVFSPEGIARMLVGWTVEAGPAGGARWRAGPPVARTPVSRPASAGGTPCRRRADSCRPGSPSGSRRAPRTSPRGCRCTGTGSRPANRPSGPW